MGNRRTNRRQSNKAPRTIPAPPPEAYHALNVAARAQVGSTLYVKAYATRVMKDITPTSDVLLIILPGDAVVWQGAHEKDKRWHKVTVTSWRRLQSGSGVTISPPRGTKVTGYVFGTNLSIEPPDMTLRAAEGAGQEPYPTAYANTGAIKG
jgi:hypothetical protein